MTRGKRKPDNVRILHGEKPRDSPLPDADDVPDPPYNMAEDVQEVWDYTTVELSRLGLLRRSDRDVLATYAEEVATLRRMRREFAEHGDRLSEVDRARGRREIRSTTHLVRQLGRELGLTPSSRQSLTTRPADDDSGSDPGRLLT